MLTETRERFLLAIAAQVPADRVAEIHFFQPIRQGGVESGVAVVVERAPVAEVPSPDTAVLDADPVVIDNGDLVEQSAAAEPTVDEPVLDEPVAEESTPDEPVVDEPIVDEPAKAEPRIVVHTARYRHTLKGIDRGKWEASVVAQADAPLIAVDAVVRGVQRRAGDLDDATRMEGDEVRAFMDARRPAARAPATT